MIDGAIVDSHHHIWNPVSGDPDLGYRWLRDIGAPKPFGDPTAIQRDYLMADYLAEYDIAASVHIQVDNALPDPVAETAWVASQARRAGHAVAIVGLVDLAAPDVEDRIAAHAAHPEFRGVRQIVARVPGRADLSFAPCDFLKDPNWLAGLACLARTGRSFDLQLYPDQARAAAAALAPHPDLAVIVDHAASPYEGDTAAWRAAITALSARPATTIKLSGWGMFDPRWTAGSIAPMVAHILESFGEDRVMFGSNYPVEKLACPFAEAVDKTAEAVMKAGGTLNAVFQETALRIYRPG